MDRWNQVVSSSNGKIYHLEQWGALINKVHGHQLIYLQEGKVVFPLALVKSFIFGNRLISLPFADYGGPCGDDEEAIEKLILEAENKARNLGVDFMEIRTPNEKYFPVFEKRGFKRRDDYLTFLINLEPDLKILWQGIGVKNRNMIKTAEKNNIEIIEARDKADLKIFYKLYLKTMKKLGSPPQSYNFFENLWDLFYPKNLLALMAKSAQDFIAAGLYFLHQDAIHHAYSCSLKANFKAGTNNLISWRAIEWGREHNFKYLDMGRTRESDGNFLFKKRWGGQLVLMPYFYKFYKKELKERQEVKYKKLSEIWARFIPEFLANKLGPWLIKQIG